MKVAVYTRVSTEEQSTETQFKQIQAYCKMKDYEIYEIYEDVISGRTKSRPSFDKLIYDMRHRRFDAVVVYKLDRIGRSLQHLLQLFQEFKNREIDFISVTQNINTESPEGKLMLRMLMILAEYERELIVARTIDTFDVYKGQIEKNGFFISRDGKKITKLGRPLGKKDVKKRKKAGYYLRWANEKHKKSTPKNLTENVC